MPALRNSDVLWLRLAALQEEPFADGVPWRLAPSRFAELERRELVEPMATPRSVRAVATESGRTLLAARKARILSSKQVAHG